MKFKKCNGCNKIKSVSFFGKESRAINGFKPRCKDCYNEYYNNNYYKYKVKKLKRDAVYRLENVEHIKKLKQKHKKQCPIKKKITNALWRKNNQQYIREMANFYEKKRYTENPHYRLIRNMRKLIYRLKANKPGVRTQSILGYSFDDLIKSIGHYPLNGETIDHKIPITWFADFTDSKIINHLDNLHILTLSENCKKNNKFCHPVSKNYFLQIQNSIKPKYKPLLKHV